MKLVVISGRSGSGKSTALNALEDEGFNCIDNFPAGLLPQLIQSNYEAEIIQDLAVCIDARNVPADLQLLPERLNALDQDDLQVQVIFLDALAHTLLQRFSETRRRHPLTHVNQDLRQAIEVELEVLTVVSELADLHIDTTNLSGADLVEMIKTRVINKSANSISLLFRSFAFKKGVPIDSDFVFDARCLPNPYWQTELRSLSGIDQPVRDFLATQTVATSLVDDICSFLETWLAEFEKTNRAYLTVAIGCTGGRHRSVYVAEKLSTHFSKKYSDVLVRHQESSVTTSAMR
jgi:UPF0042 nucleotide-binding protein